MKKYNLPTEANCSGCGACMNACPSSAITMIHSAIGFLIPKVDEKKCVACGTCNKVCPSFHPKYEGNPKPYFYSFCAQDEVRAGSSSGGVFPLVAQYILEQNGYVCSALFDENMQLKHCVTNSWHEIQKMRGSKYLQSNVGYSYRKIKELLVQEHKVLFVGTPCQVAGLQGYLGQEYENLYTIDLLCHGTPSQLAFDAYLKEISGGKKIKNVEFRSKRFGWSKSAILTTFEDGTEYIGSKNDPYKKAFDIRLMMRWSCYDCNYAKYPRQGDMTIGDLWKSEILDSESNDKKGTSFVFLNTVKGKKLFEIINKKAKYYNEIQVKEDEYDKIPNRVQPKVYRSPYRRRFLNLVKRLPFSKAVEYSITDHYDIGLPSVLLTQNIGSVLTYYAMYNVLQDMGYEVRTIGSIKGKYSDTISAEFVKKWMPGYAYPISYDSLLSMYELNQKCDMFVVGSDQIYLQSMNEVRGRIFFLQFVKSNKKVVSYASSFGGPGQEVIKNIATI